MDYGTGFDDPASGGRVGANKKKMNVSTNTATDPVASLPRDLSDELRNTVNPSLIGASTPYDLDAAGRYADGYLVLTNDQLIHFFAREGSWVPEIFSIDAVDEAVLVEGLGMNVLRIIADGKCVASFRFTLRHSRLMGEFHRKLERVLNKESEPEMLRQPAPHVQDRQVRCKECDGFIPAWSHNCPACMSRQKILFRLLDYLNPHKWRALAALFLSLLLTAMSMVQPGLSKKLVDDGLGAAPGVDANYSIVLIVVGIMSVMLILRSILQVYQNRFSMGLGNVVCRDIRNALYEHMHRLSLTFFGQRETGSLVARVTSDTQRLWDFMSTMFVSMVLAVFTLVGAAAYLFILHWKLAIFTLLPIPFMFALIAFFHGRMHRRFRRIWHRWSQMTAVIAGALPGIRVVKAFSQERREVARFRDKSNAIYSEQEALIKQNRSVFGPTMMFCGALGSLIVWFVGGYWVCNGPPGETTLGDLTAFQGFLAMFMRPIHQIAHMDEMLNRAATSAHRVFEILDTPPAIYSKSGAHEPERLEGKIELRNVSFSYDGIQKVLKNVSLTIQPGEMVGLAGPSGAGKTTLVNLICRFYDVLEGEILVDGVDVRDYELHALRSRIGVVLQEPFLFHGTIAENIAYGKPDASIDEIIAASRAANSNDFILGFPDGYDTLVGERGQTLSGGERQRISIARAILNDPTILILDEATSSVDTETEELIQQALEQLIANRTTIAIAHRLSTLRRADHLVILEKGQLAEQGTHDELTDKIDGIYAKLLSKQKGLKSIIALTS